MDEYLERLAAAAGLCTAWIDEDDVRDDEVPLVDTEEYDLGYAARIQARVITACPYRREDSSWQRWMAGWQDAGTDIEEGERCFA